MPSKEGNDGLVVVFAADTSAEEMVVVSLPKILEVIVVNSSFSSSLKSSVVCVGGAIVVGTSSMTVAFPRSGSKVGVIGVVVRSLVAIEFDVFFTSSEESVNRGTH